jgi:CP family cyanate transporter-like MFS transporter
VGVPRVSLPRPERVPAALLLGLFVTTLALRPQLVGIGPLLPRIQADLGVSHAIAGLLSTIPIICMGLFAPLGPWVASHLGPRRALAGCLVAIIGFGLARAAAPGAAAVIAMTIGIGVAIGTAGTLMAIVVKERAPRLPALTTGAYAAGIVAGSLMAAALAVPLAIVLGGWRPALAAFALAAVASLASWLFLLAPDRPAAGPRISPPTLPWRSSVGWGLALMFGLQSLLYYGVIAWLPAVYRERGWTESSAGSLVAVVNLFSLLAAIAIPVAADRVASRRQQLASIATLLVAALVGVILMPAAGGLWAVCLGFGLGAVFPLALTLPIDVASGPAEAGALTALMLLGGYLLAGVGPVVLGMIRDFTGDFSASLWLLVGVAVLFVVASLFLAPTRSSREARHEGPQA